MPPERAKIDRGPLAGRVVDVQYRPDGQPIMVVHGRNDGAGGVELCLDRETLTEGDGWQVLWFTWPKTHAGPVCMWLGPWPLRDDPEKR